MLYECEIHKFVYIGICVAVIQVMFVKFMIEFVFLLKQEFNLVFCTCGLCFFGREFCYRQGVLEFYVRVTGGSLSLRGIAY